MNYQEVKYFSGTMESRQFNRLNPDKTVPFELYKICRASIDFDNIIAFRECAEREDVTIVELLSDGNTYMLPMAYERFKEFLAKRLIDV